MARAFQSHSALGPERVQAFHLKSVHRFMLLTHTRARTHMQTHMHRFPLSSQREFSKSSRHWKFGDWCQPHSRQSVPGTSEIAASAPNRSPQLPEVQAWTTEMQQNRCGKHLTANSLRGNRWDLAEAGMSHAAVGPGVSSGPPGAGLILHREGRASRSEEAREH